MFFFFPRGLGVFPKFDYVSTIPPPELRLLFCSGFKSLYLFFCSFPPFFFSVFVFDGTLDGNGGTPGDVLTFQGLFLSLSRGFSPQWLRPLLLCCSALFLRIPVEQVLLQTLTIWVPFPPPPSVVSHHPHLL